MKFSMRLLAAAAAVATLPAHAIVVTGTTAGGPTWNRPLANGTLPPTSLSGVGTAVPFSITPFFVSAAGSYVLQSTATNPVNWDNYAFLYQTSFNPATPLANVLLGNDDNTTIGLAGFTTNLTANTQYFFITTGFANTDAGAWSLSVTGPGNITIGVVPEPGTYGLMGLGAAAVLLAARRRAAKRA